MGSLCFQITVLKDYSLNPNSSNRSFDFTSG